MGPWIANIGEGEAERREPTPDTVVVSITDPRREVARIPKGYDDILRLEFQDYDPTRLLPGKEFPSDAVLYTRQHAARVSRFARKHRGKNILIHCAAGISRSGAIAEALLQAFPEYRDTGWERFPNNHVRILTKRALGLIPLGAEMEPDASSE